MNESMNYTLDDRLEQLTDLSEGIESLKKHTKERLGRREATEEMFLDLRARCRTYRNLHAEVLNDFPLWDCALPPEIDVLPMWDRYWKAA